MARVDVGGLRERVRRRAGAAVVDGFFRGASRLGRLHPHADPARHGVRVVRDVPYREGGRTEHLLDVYRPEGEGPWPAVLYVHGGGFRILSKDTHWVMALAFARRGYAVFNMSYRLAPRDRYPAAIEDVLAAYRWVAEHGPRYGADLDRLVLAGESAGANLVTAATLAATFERDEPYAREVFELGVLPRAVVAACGILQVSDTDRFARARRLHPFLADRLHEVCEAYLGPGMTGPRGAEPRPHLDLADPLVVLESDRAAARPLPPFFAPVGTWDPLVEDSRRLAAALERRGVPCEAKLYPRQLHAFHAFVLHPAARRCWADIYRFLERAIGPTRRI
jgi:acetyl esterase